MKKTRILALIAAAVLLAGCEKEKHFSMPVSTEDYRGAGKAYINNRYACWKDGDLIKLSVAEVANYDGSIAISYSGGNTQCEVSAPGLTTPPASGSTIYAGYPRSMFSSEVTSSTSVTMPNSYTYDLENGYQKLDAPMVASVVKTSGRDSLKFVNLCAMLKVHLTTSTDAALINKIQVVKGANGVSGAKGLSGAATVSITPSTSNAPCVCSMTMQDALSGSNNTITLNLGNNAISIRNGHPADVYIPIPPLESGTAIKIRVHNALTSSWVEDAGRPVNNAVPGNVIATINAPEITESSPYTFYDYIANTATSPIDLGVTPDNTCKMEIEFSVANASVQHNITGSTSADRRTLYYAITGGSGTSNWGVSFMNTSNNNVAVIANVRASNVKNRITTEIKASTSSPGSYYAEITYMNMATGAIVSAQTGAVSGGIAGASSVYVFGTHASVSEPAGMKLYAYRIWKSGNLVHNFVPAKRRSDDHIGLYDKVGNTFKDVNSTSSFALGNN